MERRGNGGKLTNWQMATCCRAGRAEDDKGRRAITNGILENSRNHVIQSSLQSDGDALANNRAHSMKPVDVAIPEFRKGAQNSISSAVNKEVV